MYAIRSYYGYWWVDFFDEHGNALPDVNSAVYPDCKSNDYDQMIYVQADAVSLRLAFQSNSGVIVRDITLEMVSHEEASRWCDELYEQLPPLKFTPDKGRITSYNVCYTKLLRNIHPIQN